jgi:hypothetical protein
MINKRLLSAFLVHFALGLGGFLVLSGWTLGSADAGVPGPTAGAGWFATVVHYGLLQPAAHWVLAAGVIAWWTWGGLLALIALLAVNSMLVVALLAFVWRRFRTAR